MSCTLAGQAAWASGETDAALQAYRDGNYPAAIKIWRKLAANDHPDAQYALGVAYLKGHGITRDTRKAVRWFQMAAKAQHRLAQALVAYQAGAFDTAVALWKNEAQLGTSDAQYALGLVLLKGQGVRSNPKQSLQWFGAAAKAGNTAAMFNLGGMYWEGIGTTADPSMAVYWWNRAAEKRDPASQFNLGLAYYFGRGVPRNPAQATFWIQMSETNGYLGARSVLGLMQRGMLIGGLHLRPGDDAVAGGIAALETSRHESLAVSGAVMTTQPSVVTQPSTATEKTPADVQPKTTTKQAAADDPDAIRQLQEKLTTANTLNAELSRKLDTATVTSQTLQQQYDKLIATLAAVDATNAALVNENQILSARASVLGQQRTQEKKVETSLNTQLENITTAYIALEKTNTAILNEKLILTTNLNSLTKQLATQTNEKTALNDQISTLTKTQRKLETTNTTLIGEKKTSENRISELQSLLENNKGSTTALTTIIDGLKEHQQIIIASEKALTAQKVLLEQALDQQHLSAELLETENISLINRVQLLEKQESAALARTDKPGATNESLTQPDSHSDRSKLSTEAIDSFNNGLTLITQGRFDEAITVYEELIKAFPRFPQPYNNLAGVFASLGNLERAESLLRQGLELDDRYRLLRKNLGSLLIHRASRIYREAIDDEKETNAPIGDEPISLQAFDMLSPTQ